MKIIDREKFYAGYRKNFGILSTSQFNGLEFFLGKLEASEIITGATWEIVIALYAYFLATVYHECSATWRPIKERGGLKYLKSKAYWPYFGRGYCMLTWIDNFIKFGKFLGIDLKNNPDKATEPETAWKIIEEGMMRNDLTFNDPNFTAFTLDDFINETGIDFYRARKVVNRMDKASLIAGYANNFKNIIELKEAA